jgi:hypothetical protein
MEMIERFYAAHIKNTNDGSAINVRRPKSIRQVTPVMPTQPAIQIGPKSIEPETAEV